MPYLLTCMKEHGVQKKGLLPEVVIVVEGIHHIFNLKLTSGHKAGAEQWSIFFPGFLVARLGNSVCTTKTQ